MDSKPSDFQYWLDSNRPTFAEASKKRAGFAFYIKDPTKKAVFLAQTKKMLAEYVKNYFIN